MIDRRAILAYDNRFHARRHKAASYTDVGTSFSSALPLSNLGQQQLSLFAEFTGATAELSCAALDAVDNPQNFTADVLALLGHTLPTGALVEFLNGADLLAAATWRPVVGSPAHLVVALPEAVTLNTLNVRISNASTGGRIGVVWASPSLRFLLDRGWGMTAFDTGQIQRSQGQLPWSSPGNTGYTLPISFRARRVDLSHGLHLPGDSLAIPTTWDTNNSASNSGNEYTFSAASGTLLEKAGVFTAGKHYELEIHASYDAGNAGIPAVEIGTGNQWALQPGRNQIVATPDDGSDTALKILTATGTAFSGTVEILSIRECSAPQQINAKHVIETAASTEPVLWLPRTGQAWHQVAATYGQLNAGASVTHVRGPLHDVRMEIKQAL